MTTAELLSRVRLNGAVPRHVAIIMDGNGRWARERLMPRPFGHRSGMKSVREVVEGSIEAGIEVLSLFAFSKENWQRPMTEVSALMSLLEEYIAREADELEEKGVRVMSQTAHNDKLTLNLFISYGSRAEILRATQSIAADVAAGRLSVAEVTEEEFEKRLFTAGCPDPDLLIRTSGEQRISNFMLWQLAYTELFISPVLWPDFGRHQLFEAVVDYQARERRFGRVPA
jgi:undecaprenyl diphosphate synthase